MSEKVTLEVLAERMDNWMESTKEYRQDQAVRLKQLQDSVDGVLIKLGLLPCTPRAKQHEERFKWLTLSQAGLWVFLCGFLWFMINWITSKG